MVYPKKFAIQYKNQTVPVYIVGDIQYLYFVAALPKEGEVYLTLDLEGDGRCEWRELPGIRSDRAVEIGQNIIKQLSKYGYPVIPKV